MEKITSKLFSDYLSNQTVTSNPEYAALTQIALEKERELRGILNDRQAKCFEQLSDITLQIHFLEVKDAFFSACKLGASISEELLI